MKFRLKKRLSTVIYLTLGFLLVFALDIIFNYSEHYSSDIIYRSILAVISITIIIEYYKITVSAIRVINKKEKNHKETERKIKNEAKILSKHYNLSEEYTMKLLKIDYKKEKMINIMIFFFVAILNSSIIIYQIVHKSL